MSVYYPSSSRITFLFICLRLSGIARDCCYRRRTGGFLRRMYSSIRAHMVALTRTLVDASNPFGPLIISSQHPHGTHRNARGRY